MDATVRVTLKRGMYIRSYPMFDRGNEIATLKQGDTFHMTSTMKRDGWTWGRGERGYIPIANGKNMHVEQVNGKPLPL